MVKWRRSHRPSLRSWIVPFPFAVRQLTASAREEPTEDAQTVEEEPERAEPRPGAAGAQEGAQRPLWRRIIGR